jgi:hypothetical protein
MLADIAEGHRTEQRIAQGMQQHIAVRMGNQSATVGNTHTAQGNEVALAKPMHIVTMTYTHKKTP